MELKIKNLLIEIIDNGKGFDPNQKSTHIGLLGLRERALSIDGDLHIESEPGKGTTIRVIIPKTKLLV